MNPSPRVHIPTSDSAGEVRSDEEDVDEVESEASHSDPDTDEECLEARTGEQKHCDATEEVLEDVGTPVLEKLDRYEDYFECFPERSLGRGDQILFKLDVKTPGRVPGWYEGKLKLQIHGRLRWATVGTFNTHCRALPELRVVRSSEE